MDTAPVKVIAPARRWRMPDFAELWGYRDLILVLVQRDLRVRYKQSLLGAAWIVLRPLGTMAIFTLVFGFLVPVPTGGTPYAPFVLAGLLPWICFSGAVTAGGSSLVSSAGLIGKASFPRLAVPVSAAAGSFFDLLVSTAFLLALLPLFGVPWTARLLALPLLYASLAACALGAGILAGALAVSYRDTGGLVAYLLQVGMYATPVVYPSTVVPERWRPLYGLNPMAANVEGIRAALLGQPLDPAPLALSAGLSLLLLLAALFHFGTAERRFADEV